MQTFQIYYTAIPADSLPKGKVPHEVRMDITPIPKPHEELQLKETFVNQIKTWMLTRNNQAKVEVELKPIEYIHYNKTAPACRLRAILLIEDPANAQIDERVRVLPPTNFVYPNFKLVSPQIAERIS